MPDVAVVDYGMGNLRSVAKALVHVAPGAAVVVTDDRADDPRRRPRRAAGQSAMPDCMAHLDVHGPARASSRNACATARSSASASDCRCCSSTSEEGPTTCLGALPGQRAHVQRRAHGSARRASASRCRTWAGARSRKPGPIRCGRASTTARASTSRTATTRFRTIAAIVAGTAAYPVPFTCAIARANIFAVQFHPEKSQRAGLRLLANFVAWDGHAGKPRFPRVAPSSFPPSAVLLPMQIIPAIDIKDGHCVRLQPGRHAGGDGVLGRSRGDGAPLAGAGRTAPPPRRPERRGRRQAEERARDPRSRQRHRRRDPDPARRRHPRPRHDRALSRRRHQLRDHRHRRGEEPRVPARRLLCVSRATSSSGSTRATARSRPTAGRR